MHAKELLCLDTCSLHFVLGPVYYPSRVSDYWQGEAAYCPNLVFAIELTSQELPDLLEAFDCGCFLVVAMRLWDD